jgi:hypothetical protein
MPRRRKVRCSVVRIARLSSTSRSFIPGNLARAFEGVGDKTGELIVERHGGIKPDGPVPRPLIKPSPLKRERMLRTGRYPTKVT